MAPIHSDAHAAARAGKLRRWLRQDIERPLQDLAGGPARLKVIVLLACVLSLDAADKATVGAVATPIEAALHIGNLQLGWLVTASTAVAAVTTLPFGALVDRVRRVHLLAVALVVWSATMVASGLAPSYPLLLLSRLALGVVASVASPAVTSLTGDFFRPGERGRIFGYVLAGELLGVAFGFLVSGNVAAWWSWRVAFFVLAGLGFVLAAVLWRCLPEPARGGQSRIPVGARRVPRGGEATAGEAPSRGSLRRVIRWRGVRPRHALMTMNPATASLWRAVRYVLAVPTYRTLIAASALGYFYFTGLRTFAIVFMRGRFGLSQSAASSLAVLIGLGAIVGVLLAGRLGDGLIDRGRLTGRVLVAAGAYLLATAAFLPGLLVSTLWLAGPFFFLAAAGIGGANPAVDAARLDVMPSALWGRAEGVRATFRFALEAVAPPLFGYVSARMAGAVATGSAAAGAATGSAATARMGATGLDHTFLLMLAPLAVAGVLLLVRTTRSYARDVASALAAEQRARERG
ncbi:MFS transporter [Frateuria terrea]|uniref:Predicted arabinose efflux permease, MFS family n=1 Tax=Frateuria terrea TaxID=529704 RepID=A0A1H6U822_9GAMM|nr:MFS transporter [Frateuria terrea]SEI85747.1 Predicted arabinose efflux permease, MFS family [Frateuria terrea]SFP39212.1 Predicted arabinose efflux permease, MFS family [Frateuria terrea]